MVLQRLKSVVILMLRYVFLVGLLAYHWGLNTWNSITAPLDPLVDEARKLPTSEISVGGIVRTLSRAAFLAMLLGYHYTKMTADFFLVPVSHWLMALRHSLGIPDNYGKKAVEPVD